jgi:hypothetical protein
MSWSDVIARQGEEYARKQQAALEEAEALLPSKILELKEASGTTLVQMLEHFQGSGNPRMMQIIQKYRSAIADEIIGRMSH